MTEITPDQVVFWQWGWFKLNATIVFTWVVMALLAGGSWLVTRRLSTGTKLSRPQHLAEMLIGFIENEIRETAGEKATRVFPLIATLLLFIGLSNLLMVVPGFVSPTASLSTAAALALCVFVTAPAYGILDRGLPGYLKQYAEPTPIMLPFNIIGELSRTLALAVRLFGNIMSGLKVGAILLAVIPFVFPVFLHVLGLLTGMIQAYIFGVLGTVYIASAMETHKHTGGDGNTGEEAG